MNNPPDNENLTRVISAEKLSDGDRVVVDVNGVQVVVFNVDDEYYALANFCPHQSGPIAKGSISGKIAAEMTDEDWEYSYECDGELIACPWHGWQFDVKSGEHKGNSGKKIPTYNVVVEENMIFLEYK